MSAYLRRVSAVTPPETRRRLVVVVPHSPSTVRFYNSPTSLLSQRSILVTRGTQVHRRIELRSDGAERFSMFPMLLRCNCATEEVDRSAEERESDTAVEAAEKTVERESDTPVRAAVMVERESDSVVEVAVAAAVTVVLGVGNRVLYKLALVPLKQYPFFLAQFATFGYVVVYFTILYIRRRAGIVTKEMLSLPQLPYIAVGLLEALAAASGMAAGIIFLGRRYNANQLIGCFLVSMGVIITVASGSSAGPSMNGAGIFWNILMIFSFFLQAADTIVKEVIFLDGAERLKEGSVDLFVVNSFGSAYQALFICLLLPFLSKLWGIPFYQLPSYLKDGAGCFLNINNLSTGCSGAPLLPVLFVIVNMGFNISLLHLLKISSAVVSCLASTVSVPLSVFLFTLPLPYLGPGTALPPGFVAGAVILVLGLIFYARRPVMVPATAATS